MDDRQTQKILVGEFDATVWAREWIKVLTRHPEISHDEACMVGWFANAIMAGYDHAVKQSREGVEFASMKKEREA